MGFNDFFLFVSLSVDGLLEMKKIDSLNIDICNLSDEDESIIMGAAGTGATAAAGTTTSGPGPSTSSHHQNYQNQLSLDDSTTISSSNNSNNNIQQLQRQPSKLFRQRAPINQQQLLHKTIDHDTYLMETSLMVINLTNESNNSPSTTIQISGVLPDETGGSEIVLSPAKLGQ